MKHKIIKRISIVLLFTMTYQLLFPLTALALTGGPSQPEVQGFTPASATEMVDLFTGDFSYNIPLLDVGGYPVNISYRSGVRMDQEASWVGLGWSLNPGVLNRDMRGLPDDFKGDQVTRYMHMKPNETFGLKLGVGVNVMEDVAFVPKASASGESGLGIIYNTYRGFGVERYKSLSGMIGTEGGTGLDANLSAGLSITNSTLDGTDIVPHASAELGVHAVVGVGVGYTISAPYNSRTGLKQLTQSMNIGVGFYVDGDRKADKQYDDFFSKLNAAAGKQIFAMSTPDYTHEALGMSVTTALPPISFGSQSYTPYSPNSYNTFSFLFRTSLGKYTKTLFKYTWGTGHYTSSTLKNAVLNQQGYGNMYDYQNNSAENLADFNREKDQIFNEHMSNLPLATMSYDLYNYSAQGAGGSFHVQKNGANITQESSTNNNNSSYNATVKVGWGDVVKASGAGGFVDINANYSSWRNDNKLYNNLQQSNSSLKNANQVTKPWYFKVSSENTPIDNRQACYQYLGKALAPKVEKSGLLGNTTGAYVDEDGNEVSLDANTLSVGNIQRNTYITHKTVSESDQCFDKRIHLYHPESSSLFGRSRKANNRPEHHTTEISVVNNNGQKYIYGIPAYNEKEVDITYTSEGAFSRETGLIDYNENIVQNKKGQGIDEFYEQRELPAYAHSYLLTAILSPDYIDRTGDGCSPDDYGTYTKFNYELTNAAYQWRTPFTEAYLSEGYQSDNYDNKGSLIYGTKQIWHLRTIETKSYIARFNLNGTSDEPRHDGFGANPEGGIHNNSKSFYLKSISLFAKGNLTEPIKTVHFVYDQSLCPGIPNSNQANGGKLTLKEIYYTFGNSNAGAYSRYKFAYTNSTYPYHIKGYDRWGHYKPNNASLPNAEFPYVDQDDPNTDNYAAAWTLNQITLPTGGEINIEYEADDYAYVQDQQAMRMFKLHGFGKTEAEALSGENTLYDLNLIKSLQSGSIRKYTSFEITDAALGDLSPSDPNFLNKLRRRLLPSKAVDGNTYVFFNAYINIGNNEQNAREYVKGYAKITNFLSYHVQDGKKYLIIEFVKFNDAYHPLSYAAWQKVRREMPYVLHPLSDYRRAPITNTKSFIKKMISYSKDILTPFANFNEVMFTRGFGKEIENEKSWIRLNCINGHKKGGGLRVKKISITDKWADMAGGNTQSQMLGQEFSYTKEAVINGETRTISSGVTNYEPIIGGEENPFHQPKFYEEKALLAPTEYLYQEGPFGESMYPSPVVGYSKVAVRNLSHQDVTKNTTGHTEYQFYTSQEFPIIHKETQIQPISQYKPFGGIFDLSSYTTKIAAQGYYVEINNMHGVLKSVVYYNRDNEATKGAYYVVKTDDIPISAVEDEKHTKKIIEYLASTSPKHLNNDIKTVNERGTISTQKHGIVSEMTYDFRDASTITKNGDLLLGAEFFKIETPVGPLPIILPNLNIGFSKSTTAYRSAVLTRYVVRNPIMERVINFDNGHYVSAVNRLYDANTGEIVLTSSKNEYEDDIYSFAYPAYWKYGELGTTASNEGITFNGITTYPYNGLTKTGGYLVFPTGTQIGAYLSHGDMVHISTTGSFDKDCWIYIKNGYYYLMNKEGKFIYLSNIIPNGFTLSIKKSARRNQLTVKMGNINTQNNPASGSNLNFSAGILNASANTFNNVWPTNCCRLNLPANSPVPGAANTLLNDLLNFLEITKDANGSSLFTLAVNNPGVMQVANIDNTNTYSSIMLNMFNTSAMKNILSTECDFATQTPQYRIKVTYNSTLKTFEIIIFDYANNCQLFPFTLSYPNAVTYNFSGVQQINSTGPLSSSFRKSIISIVKSDNSTINNFELSSDYDLFVSATPIICSGADASRDNINPFINSLITSWLPYQAYRFREKRTTYSTSRVMNTRTEGAYASFSPFWVFNTATQTATEAATQQYNNLQTSSSTKWIVFGQTERFNDHGSILESKDALNHYTSQTYDPMGRTTIGAAANSKFSEMGVLDFEFTPSSCDIHNNWNFAINPDMVVSTESHTGRKSIQVKRITRRVQAKHQTSN